MAILILRSARGWNVRQTAKVFGITEETISRWMKTLDDDDKPMHIISDKGSVLAVEIQVHQECRHAPLPRMVQALIKDSITKSLSTSTMAAFSLRALVRHDSLRQSQNVSSLPGTGVARKLDAEEPDTHNDLLAQRDKSTGGDQRAWTSEHYGYPTNFTQLEVMLRGKYTFAQPYCPYGDHQASPYVLMPPPDRDMTRFPLLVCTNCDLALYGFHDGAISINNSSEIATMDKIDGQRDRTPHR